jgi:hypothetical protein
MASSSTFATESPAMTAQVNDSVVHQGRTFTLAGINGTGLFEPAEHGLTSDMGSTDCRRGFYCTYAVTAGTLRLRDAYIYLKPPEQKLFGKQAEYLPNESIFVFRELEAPVPFTGTLLLADGLRRELAVNMGFHPAWKYTEVHELRVEAGRVLSVEDRSAEMARMREERSKLPLQPRSSRGNEDAVAEWIERCFRRDY